MDPRTFLGAAISALEGTSARQRVWATAQYLSYAKPGEVVDISGPAGPDLERPRALRIPIPLANRRPA